jgi:hypothetical protein
MVGPVLGENDDDASVTRQEWKQRLSDIWNPVWNCKLSGEFVKSEILQDAASAICWFYLNSWFWSQKGRGGKTSCALFTGRIGHDDPPRPHSRWRFREREFTCFKSAAPCVSDSSGQKGRRKWIHPHGHGSVAGAISWKLPPGRTFSHPGNHPP